MLKRLFFLSLMAGMVGMPYLVSSAGDWWTSLTSRFSTSAADAKTTAPRAPAKGSVPGETPGSNYKLAGFDPTAKPRQIEGSTAQDLSEVIQFEGTPSWVMGRWPRVTAGLAELDLHGYRVPLVSGTSQDDLAGSLTYYFDKEQRMARIVFHGTTGDPRKVIALVTSKYDFHAQQTSDPGLTLFQARWNGKPHSELRIKPARVLRADQPNARYEIDLAIRRP